jgi:hyperosmotically inducible protein
VDTKEGVVTLNGPAPNAAAKSKATDIAKQVQGVTSVNNQLVVTPG